MRRLFSFLDHQPVLHGSSSRATVSSSIQLAMLADRLGYHRLWYTEHHNGPRQACAAPEIMVAQIAAVTERLRVGSGGVMLLNHAPLKVAETFCLLEALNPGRIDLGIGRAPTDLPTMVALCRSADIARADDYEGQLAELLGFDSGFPAGHDFAGIRVTPEDIRLPPIWLLGSSIVSAQLAARLGLGYAHAGFINLDKSVEALRLYRDTFVPSARYAEPRAILAVSVLVGQDAEEVRRLGNAYGLFYLLARAKQLHRYPGEAAAANASFTPAERAAIESNPKRPVIGEAQSVRQQLDALADRAGVDELMIQVLQQEHASRERVLIALAHAFGLDSAEPAQDASALVFRT